MVAKFRIGNLAWCLAYLSDSRKAYWKVCNKTNTVEFA